MNSQWLLIEIDRKYIYLLSINKIYKFMLLVEFRVWTDEKWQNDWIITQIQTNTPI